MLNKKSIFGSLCCFIVVTSSHAAEYEMRVATWLSPSHTMNTNVLPTWGKWIEKATEGRVKMKLEYDLAHPKSLVDLVEDNAVDASWTFHGYLPGRFKLTQMAELPSQISNAEAASVAQWRVNQKYFSNSIENKGVYLAGLFLHGPGQVHMREPISSLKDIAGKKIRVGGGISTQVGERLHVSGVNAPATKAYEMLSQGVADGLFMQMDMMKVARFKDVAPYTYKLPNGLYLGSFGIFISPDFLAKLSEKDQTAIKSVSGEKLSALAGRYWQEADTIAEQDIIQSGSKVSGFSQADIGYFNQQMQGLDEEWIKSVKSRKVDATAALSEFRQEAANYTSLQLTD